MALSGGRSPVEGKMTYSPGLSHQQRYTRPLPHSQMHPQQQQFHYTPATNSSHSPLHLQSSKMASHPSAHHSGASNPRYHPRASILIIGMKGSGKTTLGLIANRALGKTLIDADRIFENREEQTIEHFVKAKGWAAFREKESQILKDLLARYPNDCIIACGGGVIETEESIRALREARRTMPVINVLREREAILSHLRRLKESNILLDYGEEETQLMARREPLYRKCSTHTFVNLTCDQENMEVVTTSSGTSTPRNGAPRATSIAVYPLKYKQVGESFIRLIRQILGDARMRHASASRPVSRSTSRPSSPGVSFAPHPRGSISHLTAAHGPGPNTLEAASSSMTLPTGLSIASGSLQYPTLPRKADPTNRASLLTRRTTAMSLTFPDAASVKSSTFKEIVQGVDAVEVRVDMLACLQPATFTSRSKNLHVEPIVDVYEVARQLELVRRIAPGVPLLFTLRSDREGGRFFDDRNRHQRHMASPYSQALYFALLELAISTGVELLDVEMGWDAELTRRLIDRRERTKIVVSYHDLNGALHWESDVPLKLYQRATREFGSGVHLVELIGTASRSHIEQNNYLSSFAAKLNSDAAADRSRNMPPLMALNMGLAGRSSRPFNDVLDFVSHPALPTRAGPGQMSLRETMETLVRFGVYQPCTFHLITSQFDSRLLSKAIKISFEEFGLPYQLQSMSEADTLERYVEHNKHSREEAIDWQLKGSDDFSSGLFLGRSRLALQQRELFDVMEVRHPTHLTLMARVTRAVDVFARQDVSQSLLGTEHGRRVPNALGDIRGPLIGCHTLPHSIYRVLNTNTAPINAAGVNASAVVVSLKSTTGSNVEAAAIEIAARSSLFALAKLGFGDVYLLEEEKGTMENIIGDIIHLVRNSPVDILDEKTSGQYETSMTASSSSDTAPRCHFTTINLHHLAESEVKGSSDAIRKPRAIIIVGGDEEKQERAMHLLRDTDSRSEEGLVLPKGTWGTLFGGTILRIPSVSSSAYGEQIKKGGYEVEAGVTWERGGWIHVAPWIIERDRVQKGVVEAWTRRGAPVQSMQEGWKEASPSMTSEAV